ncbi:hypothetical protein FOQG_18150 [Fusarium oxysporum f. sp. raphani 54005]|uniref:HTH CENPB-type domain-containing protein n=1 Tax=Fusarium oxysporum f. sp. raphani 54005 TaxID=1089458 RepID=X0BF83_FUSOX|nr:hypothetical protein FOQG_18150 [Fusarium oxysporum f. sp. raphani 54005]
MEPTDQLAKTVELPPFTAHGEGDILTPSELAYAQLGLATEFDNITHVTQDSFPTLQQDSGEPQGQNLLSWQLQDFAHPSTDATSVSVGNPIQPPHWSWQASPSPWSLQDQTQEIWPHRHQAGLGEVSPTWELGQGAAKALQQSPSVQIQPHGLPRRRSRYLRSPALPVASGSSPIETSGSGTLVDGAMDPIQRWRNSPPETEAASLVAIADALRNTPLRGSASISSLKNRRMDVQAGSTVSFTSGSSLSSGSATSASSVARRGRVLKRTRPNAAKGKTVEKRRFPCTFCCDSFKNVTDNGLSQNQAAQKNGMPPTALSDRLRGVPSRAEVTQPAQLLSKVEESRLAAWILRQEALGYAPSHSQVRATVTALLRQQGRERPMGVHWLARFIKRHPSIKTKMGKRQEASRFNCFTPTAVNWYFAIRESEYGWIKPENTVNVDEGGIMAGFDKGLDSLVILSSDPKRKAFLKGSQFRAWTSFIEAVTADGCLLKPGIIFKGKELQKQWFVDELKEVADWYYITSDNGWTDNHIAVEWLKQVYLPQTQPEDESDARLIILDGHKCHVPDDLLLLASSLLSWPTTLDNGVFNSSKAAYRKELQKLTSLTDSAPVDKVNFIKAYAKARDVGMTKKNMVSGWRVTGNWLISRRKALTHPEVQPDKKETTPASDGHRDRQVDSDNTPKTSRHIRDRGKNKSPSTRRRYSVISKGFEAQESKIASLSSRVAGLEEEAGRLNRGKKRKAIPNPNKRFVTLAEALAAGDTVSEPDKAYTETEAVEEVIEVGGVEENESSNSETEELSVVRTRAARAVKRP